MEQNQSKTFVTNNVNNKNLLQGYKKIYESLYAYKNIVNKKDGAISRKNCVFLS